MLNILILNIPFGPCIAIIRKTRLQNKWLSSSSRQWWTKSDENRGKLFIYLVGWVYYNMGNKPLPNFKFPNTFLMYNVDL